MIIFYSVHPDDNVSLFNAERYISLCPYQFCCELRYSLRVDFLTLLELWLPGMSLFLV